MTNLEIVSTDYNSIIAEAVEKAPHGQEDARGYWQQIASAYVKNTGNRVGDIQSSEWMLLVRSMMDSAIRYRRQQSAKKYRAEYGDDAEFLFAS